MEKRRQLVAVLRWRYAWSTLCRNGGQGQDRTADLPLFSDGDSRRLSDMWSAVRAVHVQHRLVLDDDGLRKPRSITMCSQVG
jgi:hypothetical protein